MSRIKVSTVGDVAEVLADWLSEWKLGYHQEKIRGSWQVVITNAGKVVSRVSARKLTDAILDAMDDAQQALGLIDDEEAA